MAESPLPQWAREMSSSGPRPTIGGLLSLALAVLLAVLVWRAGGRRAGSRLPARRAGLRGAAAAGAPRHPLGASYGRALRACRAEVAGR